MTSKENYLFNIGDKVMLKDNLLIVEILKRHFEKKKNMYGVKYPHLEEQAREFWVSENELTEIPFNYEKQIFNAYIEYRHKYYELLDRLLTPYYRKKY